jgi:uncharacterized repeat protein (TIGR01451 family)
VRSSGKRPRWALGLACAVALVALPLLGAQPAVGQSDPSFDLSVTKSGPANKPAGSDISYSITVANDGPDDAENVTFRDFTPEFTSFVSVAQESGPTFSCPDPPPENPTLICTIASLPSGSSATFTMVVHLDSETPDGTDIVNTADIFADTPDVNGDNNSAQVTTTVGSTTADLSVTKSGPANKPADSDISYSITVANGGPDDAENVSLTDAVPENTTFVSANQDSGPAFSCTDPSPGTPTLTCSISSMSNGSSATFTVVVHVDSETPDGTVIVNEADVSAANPDTDDANNHGQATTTVGPTTGDLSVTKSGPAKAPAGTDISYSITVANGGPDDAENVTLTDPVPENTTFVSANQDSGPAFSCTDPSEENALVLGCTISSLSSGSSATFTMVVHVDSETSDGTLIFNQVQVGGTNDPDEDNNNSNWSSTVEPFTADLSVAKDAPATVAPGGNIDYFITLNNDGPDDAQNVTLTDTLPANTTFVGVSANPEWTCADPGFGMTGTVSCTTPSVGVSGPGFHLEVHVSSGATNGTVITNTASATSDTLDPNTANNSGAASTTVVVPTSPPSISKSFAPTSVPVGGSTSLSFTINNPNSSKTLTGIGFSDTLPGGLVVSTPNGLTESCGGGTITATQGTNAISLSGATLPASSSCTFSVNVTGTAAGNQNNTTSNVTSTEGGNGNTASASVTVVAPPSISKAFAPTSIPVGGSTSLSFTLTNPAANTVALTGVGFSDTLPAGLAVANTPNVNNTCGGTATAVAGSGSVSLGGGSIAINSSCTFSVDVTGTTAGPKTNTSGAVTSTNGGTGNTASASITVVAPPSISKAFGAGSIPLNGSTSLTFTLTDPNSGTALSGVGFSDTLPSGLVVATPNGLSGSCGGGTITAVAGSGTISLSGATLPAGGSCTFAVNVTGTTAGLKSNTSGAVTSTEGGTGNTASASVTVGYNVLGFFSPLPKDSYKAGATIPVKFALADAGGTRISDAEAQAIASSCRAQVRLDAGAPGCASYNASTDTFQFNLNTAKNLSKGTHTITLNVFVGPNLVSTKSTTTTIK